MARGFYRLYLYSVCSALLIFVVTTTASLLTTLLGLTPLRGSDVFLPSKATLVQTLVFAVVGWLVAGTLGGLHYWLIQRDLRNDPASAQSGVRSFFLNILEALGLLSAISIIGFGGIEARAQFAAIDVAGSTAIGLTILAMVVVLEWERRRTVMQRGAALVFQRLHFFGVQGILLSFVITVFFTDLTLLVDLLFFQGSFCRQFDCAFYNVWGLGLTLLWFVACWLVYGLVTRTDLSRTARLVLHGASLALGVGYVIYSVFLVIQLAIKPFFHLAQDIDYIRYAFISPLLLGILVVGIYHILLRDISRRGLLEAPRRHLTERAIVGLVLAGTFWWGIEVILFNLFEGQAAVTGQAWVNALALLIAGVSYIPLDLYLRRRHMLNPAHSLGARRGFVLALLGSGLLALAIGGATALYAWGTALLGSPLNNGLQITHWGCAVALVGVVVTSIYLWTARHESLWARSIQTSHASTLSLPALPATPAMPATLETILDELLAGRMNREEAVKRIRGLDNGTVEVDG